MGNSALKAATEEAEGTRRLDISQRLTPAAYAKHVSGQFVEGSLMALPWEIYYDSVTMYETINASFHVITEIPDELSLHVPHLRILNLSHNQISAVPESFHLLLHLRQLDLSYNRFKALPGNVCQLHKLQILNLANNYLKDLPQTIGKLQQLKKLNVSHNQLQALPGSLVECPALTVLVAHNNHLIYPPQAICDEGSKETLGFLRERELPTLLKKPTPQPSVFSRVRGQQVMASVNNPDSASVEYRQAQGTARTNKRRCPLMPPVHATKLKPDQLTDCLLGLVYGAAISDAFGLSAECLKDSECEFFYDEATISLEDRLTDELRSHYPPNDWSSNVDTLLLALESLMRWGGVVDELEYASQLHQWLIHGLSDLDPPSPGFLLSPLMEKVITMEGYSANPHGTADQIYRRLKADLSRGIMSETSPTDNMCLPPALVLGIPNFYKEHEVLMNAERICLATHSDPLAVGAAKAISLLVARLLQGEMMEEESLKSNIADIKEMVIQELKEEIHIEMIHKAYDNESHVIHGGDVITTLKLVNSALMKRKDDFKTCVTSVLMKGGQGAAAHSTVVGGVLGLARGYSALPQDWLAQLPQNNIQWLNGKLNILLDLFGLP